MAMTRQGQGRSVKAEASQRQKTRDRGEVEAAKILPRGASRQGNCPEDYITGC